MNNAATVFGERFEEFLRILESLVRNGPSLLHAFGNLVGNRPANVGLETGATFQERFDKLNFGDSNRAGLGRCKQMSCRRIPQRSAVLQRPFKYDDRPRDIIADTLVLLFFLMIRRPPRSTLFPCPPP